MIEQYWLGWVPFDRILWSWWRGRRGRRVGWGCGWCSKRVYELILALELQFESRVLSFFFFQRLFKQKVLSLQRVQLNHHLEKRRFMNKCKINYSTEGGQLRLTWWFSIWIVSTFDLSLEWSSSIVFLTSTLSEPSLFL